MSLQILPRFFAWVVIFLIKIFNADKNSFGHLYLACGPFYTIFWTGNDTHWIFTHNASDLNTSLCLLSSHREGENSSLCLRAATTMKSICFLIIGVGVILSVFGSISAVSKIVQNLSS